MEVQFIGSVAVITSDPSASRGLYLDAHGLPLAIEPATCTVRTSTAVGSFGIWPLAQAAQACFGNPEWPADRPVPQASIEFEVTDADRVQAGPRN